MKISEKMRTKKAIEMIEDISSNEQTTNPKRDWKNTYNGLVKIYEIIHSIRSPKCRKNHPSWSDQIDQEIVLEKSKTGAKK